ncbi:MAG: hypothetical protein AAB445_02690 [Patescibacteria group bacterium]
MATVRSKHPAGIVLLEGVIAIGVILVGVVGSLVLVNTSINLGRANQDRIVGQSLAREGLEIAYSLRNSGSLRKVEDPLVSWSSYLFENALKTSDPTIYLTTYDLGNMEGAVCKVIHPSDPACTVGVSNVCTTNNDDDIALTSSRDCDVQVLGNYLFKSWPMPTGCEGVGGPPRLANAPADCDYRDDDTTNVADVTTLKDLILEQSFQFGFAYPSVATSVPPGNSPDGQLTFYNPLLASTLLQDGQYTASGHPEEVWDDNRAKVYTYQGTYLQLQNSPVDSGVVQSKYYRVVSLQPICRGTITDNGTNPPTITTHELVVDSGSASNCTDYVAANNNQGNHAADDWDTETTNVGALVTSEVRWPKADSATRVRYQEFLYDWISL